jgi:hypothetical protein
MDSATGLEGLNELNRELDAYLTSRNTNVL